MLYQVSICYYIFYYIKFILIHYFSWYTNFFDTSLFLGTQVKKDLYQEITFTKNDIGDKKQVYDQWTRDEEEDITIWYYTGQ